MQYLHWNNKIPFGFVGGLHAQYPHKKENTNYFLGGSSNTTIKNIKPMCLWAIGALLIFIKKKYPKWRGKIKKEEKNLEGKIERNKIKRKKKMKKGNNKKT